MSKEMGRRSFLKFGATLAAGLVLSEGLACAPDKSPAWLEKETTEAERKEMEKWFKEAEKIKGAGERIKFFSGKFFGRSYIKGPLGEGEDGEPKHSTRDTKPRFNIHGFDCTTFLEHSLAFARANSLNEVRGVLDKVRYKNGQVGYGNRRHWPDAQWVPGLVSEGFLKHATESIALQAGVQVDRVSVPMNAERLERSKHKVLKSSLSTDETPDGNFSTEYIRRNLSGKVERFLENGTFVNVVKQPDKNILVAIRHQAIIVKEGKETMVRHASSAAGKVIEQTWDDFVAQEGASVLGFQFLSPQIN